MLRSVVLLSVVFLLSGCVTNGALGPTTYEQTGPSSDYYQYTINWGGNYTGEKTHVYLRTRENAGNLQICGYYVKSSGNFTRMVNAWLKEAEFYMKDKTVVGTRFLIEQSKTFRARAACVTTKTKYADLKSKRNLRIRGNSVSVYF